MRLLPFAEPRPPICPDVSFKLIARALLAETFGVGLPLHRFIFSESQPAAELAAQLGLWQAMAIL